MKRIHGIGMGGMQSGPAPRVIVPKGQMGRGRRIDPHHQQQAVHHQQMIDTGDGWSAGPGTSLGPSSETSIPQSSGKETPRPVGQVAPAQRSATPKSEHDQVRIVIFVDLKTIKSAFYKKNNVYAVWTLNGNKSDTI